MQGAVVKAQAARTLLTRRRLPLHNVEDEIREYTRAAAPDGDESEGEPEISSLSELVAAIRNGKLNPRQRNQRRGGDSDRPRGPRRCANCGSTSHVTAKCPEGSVDPKDRPCWICGKPGHISRTCSQNPDKPQRSRTEVQFWSCHR